MSADPVMRHRPGWIMITMRRERMVRLASEMLAACLQAEHDGVTEIRGVLLNAFDEESGEYWEVHLHTGTVEGPMTLDSNTVRDTARITVDGPC